MGRHHVNLLTARRVLLIVAAMLLAACSGADEAAGGRIDVSDARVPVPVAANGAAYMTLTNGSDTADRLVAVSSDVAEAVELHQSTMEGGTMSMEQVDGVDIPAGGQATLEPGGFHVMLIDVTADLAEGDTVQLTLSFDNAEDQTVTAEVVPTGDMPGTDSEGAMDMGSEGGMDMGSEGAMEMGSER